MHSVSGLRSTWITIKRNSVCIFSFLNIRKHFTVIEMYKTNLLHLICNTLRNYKEF